MYFEIESTNQYFWWFTSSLVENYSEDISFVNNQKHFLNSQDKISEALHKLSHWVSPAAEWFSKPIKFRQYGPQRGGFALKNPF